MATLADLERLIGPSVYTPPQLDWVELERVLDLRLPMDYKRLFDIYGHLQFDNFLDIFRPSSNASEKRSKSILTIEDLRGYTVDDGKIIYVDSQGERLVEPYPVYPELGGLFPWGATENGDRLMWLTSSVDPEVWPTVVTDDGNYWWQYDGSFVDLLVGMMEGEVHCPIFSDFSSSRRVDQFRLDEL